MCSSSKARITRLLQRMAMPPLDSRPVMWHRSC